MYLVYSIPKIRSYNRRFIFWQVLDMSPRMYSISRTEIQTRLGNKVAFRRENIVFLLQPITGTLSHTPTCEGLRCCEVDIARGKENHTSTEGIAESWCAWLRTVQHPLILVIFTPRDI